MELLRTVKDAAIGWVVQGILGSLFTEKMEAWSREVDLDGDVEKLKSAMLFVNTVVDAAAARGRKLQNEGLCRSLLGLKQLLYDAEDVMDELDYYRLQREIEGGNGDGSAAGTHPMGDRASSSTRSFAKKIVDLALPNHRKRKREDDTLLAPESKHDVSQRINKIANQLRTAGDDVHRVLQLEISPTNAMPYQSLGEPRRNTRLTTSMQVEPKVYGRDAERNKVVELLINEKCSDLRVLPIVGGGGVGKTTLARFVFGDQRIRSHFDLQIWVCVSTVFDGVRLTREILEHVCKDGQDYGKISSFNVLQDTLLKNIRNKRFLLVLDDIWEDKDKIGWVNLLAPLKRNQVPGCTILATTRSKSVAKMIGTIHGTEACQTHITLEEYTQKCENAWQQIAQKRWCDEQWLEASPAARERRLLMDGAAHRQGSSSITRYKKNLEKKRQRLASDMEAYLEARRDDQEGTLCSQRATENLAAYTDAAKEIHGPDYDVMNSPLDATAVYKAEMGKKHDRFFMGAGYISIPTTLSEVRTTSTGSLDEVHSQRRLRPSVAMYSQLEARLQDEIEARQRLERMLQALETRLDGTPGAPPSTLPTPATVGSMADPAAPSADAEDGTRVSYPNQDHVDEIIADRPPPGKLSYLGNKEHPGRTRGLGVNVPWSHGFADDYYTYRSRKRSMADHDNQLVQRITAEFAGKIARLEDRLNQVLNQSQAAPVIVGTSPPRHRSSVTSTHNFEHEDDQLPIDGIKEPTTCKLQLRLVGSIPIEAGRGMVHPYQEGVVQHGVQVAHGYARVEVDMVHEHFMAVPLEIRPNKEITTLGDAVHSFIQWPKTDIVLDPVVPRSRHDHSSPTGPSMTPPHPSPQKATSLVPVEKTPKEQQKHVTVSVPESSRRKTLPIVKAKLKSMNIRSPPKSQKPGKYSIGKPLCPDTELARAGFACQALHAWYMRKTGKKGCDTGITVAYKDEHFFNGTGNFVVGFNDLFNLFNLEALDTSLLRCWTLYMMKNTWQGREPVGFLDPHVVSLQTIEADPTFVENYITAALLRQTHNDYIVVPYNQGFHWILLVIIPRRNKVIYLDSLVRNNHDFSILQGILDNSFISYVGQEGTYNGSSAQLTHRTKFPCRQQKNDELCAFYVCHHMQQIISAKMKNPEGLMIDLDGLVAQEIVDVRGKLCAFIMSEIVNKGEFHSVADPEFHAKN